MKDLYGLRSEDIDMLKQAGYGDDIFYVGNYGISDVPESNFSLFRSILPSKRIKPINIFMKVNEG